MAARSRIAIDLASWKTWAAALASASGIVGASIFIFDRPDVLIFLPCTLLLLAGILYSNGALVLRWSRPSANRPGEASPMWDRELDP